MEPVSIALTALGITASALDSIVKVHDAMSGLVKADQEVKDIASNLELVRRPLLALESLKISDKATQTEVEDDLKKTGIDDAVNRCAATCDDVEKNLDKWTKNSTKDHFSLGARLAVAVWHKEKLTRFHTQVQSCQANVQSAVQCAQFLVQLRSEEATLADRKKVMEQLQKLEQDIRDHAEETKKKEAETRTHAKELEDMAKELDDLQEVKEQFRLLSADQTTSDKLLKNVDKVHKLAKQIIRNVQTTENSKAFVGKAGTDTGEVDQDIRDVTTAGGSTSVVGVVRDFNLADIFKEG